MTTRAWLRRIAVIAEHLRPVAISPFIQRLREDLARRRAEHLARTPTDLRPAVAAAIDDQRDGFSDWVEEPFAPWAGIAPEFQSPRELVTWLLNLPRQWLLGHACGRCGLHVPLILTWHNVPDPPQGGVIVFPACPSCGSPTSFMATFRPDEPS